MTTAVMMVGDDDEVTTMTIINDGGDCGDL